MSSFWLEVLAETAGSVPVFGAGLWFSHSRLGRRLDAVTRQQTGQIQDITAQQTAALVQVTDQQTSVLLEDREH